jgi:hypothetical protein
MTQQIAMRLPDELVDFVDGVVRAGGERSRGACGALARPPEPRGGVAARDAEILAGAGADAEMDALARHAATTPLDID